MKQSYTHQLTSFAGAVLVPCGQAVITGSLAGLAIGGLSTVLRWPDPVGLGIAVGGAAALLAWLSYRERWQLTLERALKLEPLVIEPARAMAKTVRVELVQDQGRRGDWIELPARPEQIAALAEGVARGMALAQSLWTGSGNPFSRAEFSRLTYEMIRRGLACWKNGSAHAQGIEMTAAGRAVLRHYSPTLPTRFDQQERD